MAVITHLETDTGTNVDISGATAVGAYTANGDKLIMVDVSIDAVAGNGDYVMYVTRQIGGSGSAYRILPQTTMAAASGLTAISGQSGWITVRNGDVLTCYVDGLAGDTSTPDWTTRWFESAVTLVTLADDAITSAKFDESTAYPLKSADTGATQVARVGADSDTLETLSDEIAAVKAETALIVADTGTDGVKIADTQGAITWGQQKIVADVASQGALDIQNSHSAGIGLRNNGNIAQYNEGGAVGVANVGVTDVTGCDPAIATSGEYTSALAAIQSDLNNPDQYKADVSGLALEATLTAIKGAGWMDETLVKIVTDISAISAGSGATPQQIWEYATRVLTAGTNIDLSALATATDLATVDTVVDAIKAKTDNLPASPAAVGSAMTLTTAYDKAKDDVLTPLAVVDSIVDGLKTTLDNIHDTDLPAVKTETAAIKAKTNNLPATPASAGEYTTNIGAIKAKTDNLPASPAPANEYDAELAALQADLDNADQYKADVSGLATTIHVQEVENKVDLIDVTTVANSGKIDAVDTKVSAIDTDTVMSFMIDGFTFEQIVQIMAAVLAGKLTRSGDTLTFKDLADTVNRVVAETDANKQRTTMTYTV